MAGAALSPSPSPPSGHRPRSRRNPGGLRAACLLVLFSLALLAGLAPDAAHAQVPGKPPTPTIDQVRETSLRVTWQVPSGNPTHIQVRLTGPGGSTETYGAINGSHTFTSLTQATEYSASARGWRQTTGTFGPWSDTATATTDGMAAPTFSTVRHNQLNVNWVAASSDASPGVNRYQIAGEQVGGAALTTRNTNSSSRLANFGSLMPDTAYRFRIRVRRGNTYGSWSPWATQRTTRAQPAAPAAPTFSAVTTSRIRVNWTAPAQNGGVIGRYEVESNEVGTTRHGQARVARLGPQPHLQLPQAGHRVPVPGAGAQHPRLGRVVGLGDAVDGRAHPVPPRPRRTSPPTRG